MMIFSLAFLPFNGGKARIVDAIISHGISGGAVIRSYVVLHISIRFICLIISALSAFAIIRTIIPSADGRISTFGLDLIMRALMLIDRIILISGIALACLFVFKMTRQFVLHYINRYDNMAVFSLFSIVFGETILGLIALGTAIWLRRLVAHGVDDIASISYSLITDKHSKYGISSMFYISLTVCSMICIALSLAFSYDLFAAVSCCLLCAANLSLSVFFRKLKCLTEELEYSEFAAARRSHDV